MKVSETKSVYLVALSIVCLLFTIPSTARAQKCPCADLWNQAVVVYEENFQELSDTWLKCEHIDQELFVAMDTGVSGGTIELLNTSNRNNSNTTPGCSAWVYSNQITVEELHTNHIEFSDPHTEAPACQALISSICEGSSKNDSEISQYGPVSKTKESNSEYDISSGTASSSKSSDIELDGVGRVSKTKRVDGDFGSGEFSASKTKSAEIYGAGSVAKTKQGNANFSSGEFSGSQDKSVDIHGAGSFSQKKQGNADFSSGEFSVSKNKSADVYGVGGGSESKQANANFSSGEFSAGRQREGHIDGVGGASETKQGNADFSSGEFSAGGTRKGNLGDFASAEAGAGGTTNFNSDGNITVKTNVHGGADVGGVEVEFGGGADVSAGAGGFQTDNQVNGDIAGVKLGATATTNFSFDEVSAGASVNVGGLDIGAHVGTDGINIAGWDVDETFGNIGNEIVGVFGFGSSSEPVIPDHWQFYRSPEYGYSLHSVKRSEYQDQYGFDDYYLKITREWKVLAETYEQWRNKHGKPVLMQEELYAHILKIHPKYQNFEEIKSVHLRRLERLEEEKTHQQEMERRRIEQIEEARVQNLHNVLSKLHRSQIVWEHNCAQLNTYNGRSRQTSGELRSITLNNIDQDYMSVYRVDKNGEYVGLQGGDSDPIFTIDPGDNGTLEGHFGDVFIALDHLNECIALFNFANITSLHSKFSIQSIKSIARYAKRQALGNQSILDSQRQFESHVDAIRDAAAGAWAQRSAEIEADLANHRVDNRKIYTRHDQRYQDECAVLADKYSDGRGVLATHYFVNKSDAALTISYVNIDGLQSNYSNHPGSLFEIAASESIQMEGRANDWYSVNDEYDNCVAVVEMHPTGNSFMLGDLSQDFLIEHSTGARFEAPNISLFEALPPDDTEWNARHQQSQNEQDAQREKRQAEFEKALAEQQKMEQAALAADEQQYINQYNSQLTETWDTCSLQGIVMSPTIGENQTVTFNNIGHDPVNIWWIGPNGSLTNLDRNPYEPIRLIDAETATNIEIPRGHYVQVVSAIDGSCVAVLNTENDDYFTIGARINADSNAYTFQSMDDNNTVDENVTENGSFPIVENQQAPEICAMRGQIMSPTQEASTYLRAEFANVGKRNLHVYWINEYGEEVDYSGNSVPYFELFPGDRQQLDGYVNQVFLVVDEWDNCADIKTLTEQENSIFVR
jgi:hypothetical protein